MTAPATAADWQHSPMPEQHAALPCELSFDATEFERLTFGRIPRQMEDKWFIYFESPWLHMHRSWTGYCIYQLRFEPDGARHRVAEARVNRDPAQYDSNETADLNQLTMLLKLITARPIPR